MVYTCARGVNIARGVVQGANHENPRDAHFTPCQHLQVPDPRYWHEQDAEIRPDIEGSGDNDVQFPIDAVAGDDRIPDLCSRRALERGDQEGECEEDEDDPDEELDKVVCFASSVGNEDTDELKEDGKLFWKDNDRMENFYNVFELYVSLLSFTVPNLSHLAAYFSE